MAKSYLFAAGQLPRPIGATGGLGHGRRARVPWSPEEDDKLQRFVEDSRRQIGPQTEQLSYWKAIAKAMGTGRKARDYRDHYNNSLAPAAESKPWTPEEDQLLVAKYGELGNRWAEIADRFFPGRTGGHLRNRYIRLENNSFKSPSNETHTMRPWTEDEDAVLLEQAGRYDGKKDWSAIAEGVGNDRSEVECIGRWRRIDPSIRSAVLRIDGEGRPVSMAQPPVSVVPPAVPPQQDSYDWTALEDPGDWDDYPY